MPGLSPANSPTHSPIRNQSSQGACIDTDVQAEAAGVEPAEVVPCVALTAPQPHPGADLPPLPLQASDTDEPEEHVGAEPLALTPAIKQEFGEQFRSHLDGLTAAWSRHLQTQIDVQLAHTQRTAALGALRVADEGVSASEAEFQDWRKKALDLLEARAKMPVHKPAIDNFKARHKEVSAVRDSRLLAKQMLKELDDVSSSDDDSRIRQAWSIRKRSANVRLKSARAVRDEAWKAVRLTADAQLAAAMDALSAAALARSAAHGIRRGTARQFEISQACVEHKTWMQKDLLPLLGDRSAWMPMIAWIVEKGLGGKDQRFLKEFLNAFADAATSREIDEQDPELAEDWDSACERAMTFFLAAYYAGD